MTEKNIFAYKLFLTLNISDFSLFFMWQLQPLPEKSHPPLSQQPPLKVEALSSSPPFLKIWLEAHPPPPAERGGGAHYVHLVYLPQTQQENCLMHHFQPCQKLKKLHYSCFLINLNYLMDHYKLYHFYLSKSTFAL